MAVIPRDRRHIVLVGMMGTGKSSAGLRLAALLGRLFVDTDEEIAAVTGSTIPEIWSTEGEEKMRAVESTVLAEAIASPSPSVISVGGGAVLNPENRAAIAEAGDVVWLRARLDTLAERLGDGAGRPLLAADPAAALARIEPERRPLYEEVANAVVDVDSFEAEATVAAVLNAIQRRVEVQLAEHRYEVVVGPGARHLLSGAEHCCRPRRLKSALLTQ